MFSSEKFCSKYSTRRAIIFQSSRENHQQFSYEDIAEASQIVKCVLREFIAKDQNNIGVLLHHSAAIVPILLGILDSGASFSCLNQKQLPSELSETIELLRCNIGIADQSFPLSQSKNYETLTTFSIFNQSFFLLRLSVSDSVMESISSPGSRCIGAIGAEEDIFLSPSLMFSCITSGTTGKPKMVQVPYKSIMPNVISLSKHYRATQSDVIYISSPPTFDPFVVDLFLGLFNGATILMVSNEIRLSPGLLLSSLAKHPVTIMQITPSLFRRFPIEAIRNRLVASSSALRCLILGGEPFPSMEEVAEWFEVNDEIEMHTRLFNIYGITEVSCWSTIYELTLMDIKSKDLIPIGLPLDQHTTLKVVDSVNNVSIDNGVGELYIQSKVRQCVIHEKGKSNVSVITPTGDIVEIKFGTIYYRTRVNNMVKIFGQKVNLTKIENAAKSLRPVRDTCCVYDNVKNNLHLFVQFANGMECTKKEMLRGMRKKLLEHEIPNEIHFVDEFPLSLHGKVSKSKLLEMIEKPVDSHQNYFMDKLEDNLPGFDVETTMKSSFIAAGGNSVLALRIINELEAKFNLADPELITMLLNPDISMERVVIHLQNFRYENLTESTSEILPSVPFAWCHNLEKCIDASPTICTISNQKIVSVGSHSRKLINVDLESGQLISKITLPDRIECKVTQFNDFEIVGCYNGFLYCIDVRTGVEKWKFNSNGMIKSTACIVGNVVVFGNYNSVSNLWCVRVDDGSSIWNRKIGGKSIYSGIVETIHKHLLVATLDGVCAVIETMTGTSLWETTLQSPIFSTPKIVADKILIAEVLGIVHCLDSNFGTISCSFRAGGNIYSSIETISENVFCFGCYDKSVYCLTLQDDASSLQLLWKVETPGQIFTSPKSFMFQTTNWVLACSTDGVVSIIDLSGHIHRHFRIDGNIFSTPAVVDDKLIIASRNNFLYCFDIYEILVKEENLNVI